MREEPTTVGILGAYYLMLVAYLVASYFPEYRVWGFNWWAYTPDWARWALLTFGATVPIVLRFIPQNKTDDSDLEAETVGGDRMFFISVGVITASFGSLFYLLRARTHFLGDGYQLLDLLANQATTFMKFTEIGSATVLLRLSNLIGGDGQAAALLSYQIISITAGLLFVVATGLFARKLYERTAERVLFLLGVCTGGYMLLFFGYVENYSLFVLSVLTFSLTGLLIAQRKTSRYWILPPLLAAVFFHVLGVTLIPSALYLLIGPSRLGQSIRKWRPLTKLVALLPIMVVAAIVFHHFYTTNYFFQFAFVPLFQNRFTVEGYTMFSMNHLADFANLLFLLAPGLLIVIVSVLDHSIRRTMKQRPFVFLAVLSSSALGAAFIFDPKLGMPRDWDLFSFAGVPIVVASYYYVSANWRSNRVWYAAILSILLSLVVLAPRTVSGFQSQAVLTNYRSYLLLDIAKGRNGWIHLINYYRDQCDTLRADASLAEWKALHPEVVMIKKATQLFEVENDIRAAVSLGREIVRIAPTYPGGFALLGTCSISMRRYREALSYLEIADGLSPDRSNTLNNLAHTYCKLGELDRAESAFLRSITLDTTDVAPVYNLARLYSDQRRRVLYLKYLAIAAEFDSAPVHVVREWGDHLLSSRQFEDAADAYRRAMEKGLDSAYVRQLIEQHPQLGPHLK